MVSVQLTEEDGARKNIPDIDLTHLDVALLVIVGSLQDQTTPFTQQPLRVTLDVRAGALALVVVDDDLADAAAQKHVLVDGQLHEGAHDGTLDVVRR